MTSNNFKTDDDFCHATDPKQMVELLNNFNPDRSICFTTERLSQTTFPRPIKLWIRGEFTGDYSSEDMGISDDTDIPEFTWDEFRIKFESKQEFIDAIVSIWIPENLYSEKLRNFLESIELDGLVELTDPEQIRDEKNLY